MQIQTNYLTYRDLSFLSVKGKDDQLCSPPWNNARYSLEWAQPGSQSKPSLSTRAIPWCFSQSRSACDSVIPVVRWQSPLSHRQPCSTLKPFFSPLSSKTNQHFWHPEGWGRGGSLIRWSKHGLVNFRPVGSNPYSQAIPFNSSSPSSLLRPAVINWSN